MGCSGAARTWARVAPTELTASVSVHDVSLVDQGQELLAVDRAEAEQLSLGQVGLRIHAAAVDRPRMVVARNANGALEAAGIRLHPEAAKPVGVRERVDAILKGEIASITITPSVFNESQQATRYVITVNAKIEFRDVHADKVLWQNPALVFREDYDVATKGTTVTDPATFFGQEANALERVGSDFARTVVSAILESF